MVPDVVVVGKKNLYPSNLSVKTLAEPVSFSYYQSIPTVPRYPAPRPSPEIGQFRLRIRHFIRSKTKIKQRHTCPCPLTPSALLKNSEGKIQFWVRGNYYVYVRIYACAINDRIEKRFRYSTF